MNDFDPMQIEKALTLFGDQIKITYDQSLTSNIEPVEYDNVIVSGMGGSSNAGKIVISILENQKSPKLMVVWNDYGLPDWAGSNTLIVLNSYSGNTEETLSAYQEAQQKNCKVIGITTGGKIGDLINSGEIKGAIVNAGQTNPSGYPKSGLGLSLGALMGALTKVGLINTSKEELYSALEEINKIRAMWSVGDVAGKVNGYFPVFFASKAFLGPMNAARNACCEIGRVYTQFYDFPEVNHVLIEALGLPNTVRENKYIFFESDLDSEKIKLRFKVTKQLMQEMNANFLSYKLLGSNFLVQSLELAHFGAWLGLYLSKLRHEDPGPEPWIIKLKEAMGQPVH